MSSTSQPHFESFYTTGGTLHALAPSYVVRKADEELVQSLLKGEYCYILTSRQMGKSSLMIRAIGNLREQKVTVFALDLTSIGSNLTPDQWYDGLLLRLGRQSRLEDELEDFWQEHEKVGPAQRFFMAIQEVLLAKITGSIVLFVDELDMVLSLPFSTDEFFAGIRECFTRRTQEPEWCRLSFCLLGVATPSDLIQDKRTTPFNIGRRIVLQDFRPKEALPLAAALGYPAPQARKILGRILYWTDGHPYLTQRLCQTIANHPKKLTRIHRETDQICHQLFLSNRARERDDNLLFVRERILKSEFNLYRLLRHYQKIRRNTQISGLFRFSLRKIVPVSDEETNPMVGLLLLSGIVKNEGGLLRVRNPIYYQAFNDEWITSNLPDLERWQYWYTFLSGLREAGIFLLRIIGFTLGILAFFSALGYAIYLLVTQGLMNNTPANPPPELATPYIPSRPEAAGLKQIDLSPFYNAGLTNQWHLTDISKSLAALPQGLQTFLSVPFDVRGIIQLSGRSLANTSYPSEVSHIPIRQTCQKIHFLHGTGWSEKTGTLIGHYLIHYADGTKHYIPLLYGQDVQDWTVSSHRDLDTPYLKVAWETSLNPPTSNSSDTPPLPDQRLFLTTWTNPFPERPIQSLDFVSTMTQCSPFLIALTVE